MNMGKTLTYRELMDQNDFEYFFRFKKGQTNFDELWRMKSSARESLREWLMAVHTEPQNAEIIANASSELIENCIKYSLVDAFSFVYIHVEDRVINIETVNKTSEEQREKIKAFLEYINKREKKAAELYIEKISESLISGNSQLGLLKILMETNGSIELLENNTENDIVHLKVRMTA
jgi:hypothetical protein